MLERCELRLMNFLLELDIKMKKQSYREKYEHF